MTQLTTTYELLDAVGGHPHRNGYYRIVTSNSIIKYLSFTTPNPTFVDHRGEKLAFKTIPDGDWNIGYLINDPATENFILDSTAIKTLPSIDTWHPIKVDDMDLEEPSAGPMDGELQCLEHIYSAVYPGKLGYENVIVNKEWSPEDIYGVTHASEIYSLIKDQDFVPKFLAHVTENHDRVIGYMVERIAGRHATIADLATCRELLSKLHALNIVHGALTPASFIISEDRADLQNFVAAYVTTDEKKLNEEMASLEGILEKGVQVFKPLS